MSLFRKLSLSSRRRSDTTNGCTATQNENGTATEEHAGAPKRRRSRRSHSLGNVFTRLRPKASLYETYDTDFWDRNFQEKSTISWNEFQAALVLDYKSGVEEFAATGHFRDVLKETRDEICNKDSIVYIVRYRRYIGPDPGPDALWLKVKENTMRRVFEDGVIDSLCL